MKDSNKPIFVIAEAGVNHNGDIQKAIDLIQVASEAGADAVKFQSFKADKLVSKEAKKANYQNHNMGGSDQYQYNMLKSLELSNKYHDILITESKKRNILFLSTAFDKEGLEYLNKLGLPVLKCPSGEITNYPYLQCLAKIGKPVILSTGMANMDEIKSAIDVLTTNELNKNEITVLHCNTEYPTPMTDVNLLAMKTIGDELGVKIGYSDHTLGIEISVAAAALGAKVIEKHFTLDRNLPGPDHRASLEPNELKSMVTAIRNVEIAISGSGKKEPSPSEIKNRTVVRKSLHTKRALRKGHLISEDDLIPLRPATGINPMEISTVLGCELKSDLSKSELISWKNLKKK